MTGADRERLRVLLAKATPGPWRYTFCVTERFTQEWARLAKPNGNGRLIKPKAVEDAQEGPALLIDDAALIVAAVNHLPALLDQIEAQARRIGELEAAIEALTDGSDDWYAAVADQPDDYRVGVDLGDLRAARAALQGTAS